MDHDRIAGAETLTFASASGRAALPSMGRPVQHNPSFAEPDVRTALFMASEALAARGVFAQECLVECQSLQTQLDRLQIQKAAMTEQQQAETSKLKSKLAENALQVR